MQFPFFSLPGSVVTALRPLTKREQLASEKQKLKCFDAWTMYLALILLKLQYLFILYDSKLCVQSHCKKGKSKTVCGIDGVTYENQCFAEAERVLVDYDGACSFIPSEEGTLMNARDFFHK